MTRKPCILCLVSAVLTAMSLGGTAAAGSRAPPIEMTPQNGHTGMIKAAAFWGGNGDRLITAGGGTMKLWDLGAGLLVRTFQVPGGSIGAVAISPNGRRAVTGQYTYKEGPVLVHAWDLKSGAQTKRFEGLTHAVVGLAYSRNGKRLLGVGYSGTILLWSVASGKVLKRIEANHETRTMAWSPDEKTVLLISTKGSRLWSLRTGKKIRNQAGHQDLTGAFSPDNKLLVNGGPVRALNLWDAKTGKLVHNLFDRQGLGILAVAFDPEGRHVFSVGEDKRVGIWDVRTGKLTQKIAVRYRYGGFFSADARRLLNVARGGGATIYELPSGRVVHRLQVGNKGSVVGLALSKDGKRVRGPDFCWDLTRIAPAFDCKSLKPGHYKWVVSPDQRFAVNREGKRTNDFKTVRLVAGKAQELTFKGHTTRVGGVGWSHDSRRIISGDHAGDVKIWDAGTAQELRSFATGLPIWLVALAPDGRTVLIRAKSQTSIWDAQSGKRVRQLSAGDNQWVSGAVFSPDGRYAATAGVGVKVWHVKSGKLLHDLRGHAEISAIAFSATGRLASVGSDRIVHILNVETGQSVAFAFQRATSAEHAEWLAYTPDGYFAASRRGAELAAAVTGLRAMRVDQLAVRNNRPDLLLERIGLAPPELIAHLRARYQLRLRRLGVDEKKLTRSLTRAPEARIVDLTKNGCEATVTLEFRARGAALKSFQLFADDVPLLGPLGLPLQGKRQKRTQKVQLLQGENRIEASVLDRAGVESLRDIRLVKCDVAQPKALYFLGFGVSKYQDASLELRFAHKDVLDLARAFSAGKTFSAVHTKTFVNDQVTVSTIKDAARFLAEARPEDVLVLFIAGHGLHDTDPAATYYFLTHEANLGDLAGTAAPFDLFEDLLVNASPRHKLFLMDTCESGEVDEQQEAVAFQQATKHGLTARTIRGIKKKSAARFVPGRRRWLQSRERFIYVDLARRSGSIVLSSSRGGEFSYESQAVENGFFTEEILSALTSAVADKDKNRLLSTDELRRYVSRAVSKRTDGLQNPTVDRENIHQKFAFPIQQDKVGR